VPLCLAAITVLAAALRLAYLGAVVSDPFYDGAVRSMGLSWHNFFFGAVEPSGAVAIDKPPIDLWLQVASVKVFGLGSFTLKLPEALAGTVAVPLLFAAVRPVFGAAAGLASALALAVLPIGVITARSDTMDAVMMALIVLALLLLVRAALTGRTLWLLCSAAALGVAFDVKLLESLIALPGLALLAWFGLPGSRLRRAKQLALAGVVYGVVALSWLSATLLYPAHERPWAYGSTNGSAWNSAFVFNGIDRLSGKSLEGSQSAFQSGFPYPVATWAERDAVPILPPSPTRLLARVGPLSGARLGLEAFAGLLLFGMMFGSMLGVLPWERRHAAFERRVRGRCFDELEPIDERVRRAQRAMTAGLFLWLLTGLVLFSGMARLHPRYTEAFTPAVASTFGIGLAWAALRRGPARRYGLTATLLAAILYAERLLFGPSLLWALVVAAGLAAFVPVWIGIPQVVRPLLFACALVSLLAVPFSAALRAVGENISDTNRLGVLHPGELQPLSAYLRAHQGNAYYEAAFDSGTRMGELVVKDARPILVLTTLEGRLFTPLARLRALAAAGRVRYAFIDGGCGPSSPATNPDCSPPARWVVANGTDVSPAAGLPRAGMLWRLP
jgi:4-amino-4-deoxy-L-arabinose transferase-like glycosyltransferase